MKKGNNGLDLRSQNTFLLPKANTVHYGHDSVKYLGCKIWNIIPPNEMKLCESVEERLNPAIKSGYQINVHADFANHI